MQSEFYRQFHKFIENALDPIIGINTNGFIQSFNTSAEQVFGWHKSEAIGRRFVEILITPLHHSIVEKELKQALRNNGDALYSHQSIEVTAIRHDNVEFPVEMAVSLLKIDHDYIFFAFVKDITHRSYPIQDIRESEVKYRQLVEGIEDYGIFMLDRSGIIVSWNKGAERINGYKREEVLGKHFSIFYPQQDVEAGKLEMELRLAASVGKYEEEGWRVKKDGSPFWASVLITPLWGGDGKVQGFAKVVRDLTAKKAEEKL